MYKSLMKLGVKEGDTVIVGEVSCFCLISMFIGQLSSSRSMHQPYASIISSNFQIVFALSVLQSQH